MENNKEKLEELRQIVAINLERVARFKDDVRSADYARLENYAERLLQSIQEAKEVTFPLF